MRPSRLIGHRKNNHRFSPSRSAPDIEIPTLGKNYVRLEAISRAAAVPLGSLETAPLSCSYHQQVLRSHKGYVWNRRVRSRRRLLRRLSILQGYVWNHRDQREGQIPISPFNPTRVRLELGVHTDSTGLLGFQSYKGTSGTVGFGSGSAYLDVFQSYKGTSGTRGWRADQPSCSPFNPTRVRLELRHLGDRRGYGRLSILQGYVWNLPAHSGLEA